MDTLHPKVIELLKVSPSKNLGYLKIRMLSMTNEKTVYWRIDQQTALNIQKIIQQKRSGNYRLSQSTFIDLQTNQIKSRLSWTVGNKSQSYTFICSKQYALQLNQLQLIQNIENIVSLQFISEQKIALSSFRNRWIKRLDLAPLRINLKLPKGLLRWLARAAIILFILAGTAYMTQNNLNLLQAMETDNLKTNKNYVSTVNYIPYSDEATNKTSPENIKRDPDKFNRSKQKGHEQPVKERLTNEETTKPTEKSSKPLENDQQAYEINQKINQQQLPPIKDEQREPSRYQGNQKKEQINYQINHLPANQVALTFDDGPSKYTKEIANILLDYDVGGTFFFVGDRVKQYENKAKYVVDKGLAVGSHSMSHENIPTLQRSKQKADFINAMQTIEQATGKNLTLYRPPYGEINDYMSELLIEHDQKVVLWTIDTEDWKHRDPKEILNRIQAKDPAGSIILMHENEAVVAALPSIIEHLQQLGLEIVNIQ